MAWLPDGEKMLISSLNFILCSVSANTQFDVAVDHITDSMLLNLGLRRT